MLIWSSKMAVTTEMRKSARNLVIIFNPWHLFKLCTFLDGASQSGQRSRDLVLPTSGSCSPSANNSQGGFGSSTISACHLNFIFSESIAMGSHELHNSFKIPLSRTNGMAKNSCISLKNPQCSIYFLGPLGLLGKLLLFLSPWERNRWSD